jgi:hypothetical protein
MNKYSSLAVLLIASAYLTIHLPGVEVKAAEMEMDV